MSDVVESARFGSENGSPFRDELQSDVTLTRVEVWHGSYVDSVQSVWTFPGGQTISGIQHGSTGGTQSSVILEPGEFITKVEGRAGSIIDQLVFHTNTGRSFGPFGSNGGNPFAIEDLHVLGFCGRSGQMLDQLGFLTLKSAPGQTPA